MALRTGSATIALLSALASGFLAINHPLGALTAPAAVAAFASLTFLKPDAFLIYIPALLPISGLAPWSGWITFEELDMLVLATAAGLYARSAFAPLRQQHTGRSILLPVLVILMSLLLLISMARGFMDAGGFHFGWFQGYDGPMNSVRIGKGFFLALLLAPQIVVRLHKIQPSEVARKLAIGLTLGLGTASLAATWERISFPGFLNFSSDYRTTALFWEMHVGGAALDGWLLLTAPFAVWALRASNSLARLLAALLLTAIAAYAALTTFSRGVYLALLVALPLLGWLISRQQRHAESDPQRPRWGGRRWFSAALLLCVLAGLVFDKGGYRGLLALMGLIGTALSIPSIVRKLSFGQIALGITIGIVSGGILVITASPVPKGPYIFYAGILSATGYLLFRTKNGLTESNGMLAVAAFSCLTINTAAVSIHWGGPEAQPGSLAAVGILLAVLAWGSASRKPLWPDQLHWQGSLVALAAAVFTVVAVFFGGAYMDTRFETSGQDFKGRLSHWRTTLDMLTTPLDLILGKGLGRFPANYFFAIPNNTFPGTYQVKQDADSPSLQLVAPRHPISFGDMLRVSQRLPPDAIGPFVLDLKIKAASKVTVHAEVCEKHLLYPGKCSVGNVSTNGTNREWQALSIQLKGPLLLNTLWSPPRFKVFSIAIDNNSGKAETSELVLSVQGGNNLLKNGRFEDQMRYWFFSSDRDHMPWHAKNLFINIMFDQGLLGLSAFLLLTLSVLWRLILGRGKDYWPAPYIASAIVGFLIVGFFDSLMDVPRLAFFYFLLTFYGLILGNTKGTSQNGSREQTHQLSKAELTAQHVASAI